MEIMIEFIVILLVMIIIPIPFLFPFVYDSDWFENYFWEDKKLFQLFWHFINDDPELKLGLCPVCGNRCRFKNLVIGYRHHCSPECFWEDKKLFQRIMNYISKLINTNLKLNQIIKMELN